MTLESSVTTPAHTHKYHATVTVQRARVRALPGSFALLRALVEAEAQQARQAGFELRACARREGGAGRSP